MNENYLKFLKSKVIIAENFGIDTSKIEYSEILFPHQKDLVNFGLRGGRRAYFCNFGLGKTFLQLETGRILMQMFDKPFIICCPLGVVGEFKRDNEKLKTGFNIDYITDTDEISTLKTQFYITNYERVRKGDINADLFCGVSFDEASILRNLQSETTQYVLHHFKKVPFRFVATATPTPNDFIEILNYADFLGVANRGHLLTRFFQRDSQKAGNLKLYDNKKTEFWQWVSTWAAFINKPSDLGYSDAGYNMPKINIIKHLIDYKIDYTPTNKRGDLLLFKDTSKSLLDVSREKRDGMEYRMSKVKEITDNQPNDNFIIWHHLESEREDLEKLYKSDNYRAVFGSQDNKLKEKNLIDFSEGKYQYLLTKPKIAGSGCNFQYHCNNMIFAGIDFKFNDFIQAVHRIYRFMQTKECNVHIIYTINEQQVLNTLFEKWAKHKELQTEMVNLVKEYGLNNNLIKSQMERQIFKNGNKIEFEGIKLYNNDTVIVHDDKIEMTDNSVDLYVTSIPFGDHYEYSENYNDFGHNHGNEKFFEQMDFLIPNMLRCLKPGRVAAIHVKDRIRYSYQNGTSFTTISDFSGKTVAAFEKHGFYLIGKITVTTDVVAENNQTYRLGWTEQCKDGSKMGVGLPEYVLLFRKKPSSNDNSYADLPVFKEKSEYTKAKWQLDAHAYWRSSGNRFLTSDELSKFEVSKICEIWKKHNKSDIYDFLKHLELCETLDEKEKLSSTFMTLPVHSNNENVWTDVNRMKTLNAKQVSAKKEKHICPLQFDIIERLIERYSMKGEVICDPFSGLHSTGYKALEMKRKYVGIELNTDYFLDGIFYIKSLISKLTAPKLFDFVE